MLRGEPFVHTFTYGCEYGELVFVEPMAVRDVLTSRSDRARSLATPQRYGTPGCCPTRCNVGYDEEEGVYRVMLKGLWRAGHDRVPATEEPPPRGSRRR